MLCVVLVSFRISDVNLLTIEEQEKFLEIAKRFHNYLKYVLILETGLRTHEMIGLAWDAINFQYRTLKFNKTLEYIESGVNPKALQCLLWHASLHVTMDTYVHVTDESMNQAVKQFEGKMA